MPRNHKTDALAAYIKNIKGVFTGRLSTTQLNIQKTPQFIPGYN